MNRQPRVSYTVTPPWRAVIVTFVFLILALAPVAPLVKDVQRRTRGIVFGVPPRIPHTDVRPYATNADLLYLDDATLARALALLQEAGFGTIRVRFPWFDIETSPGVYDWQEWDRLVEAAQARGLNIIALIDGTPPWLRPPGEEDNPVVPPTDMDAFAEFAARVASRYKDVIDDYQIWDQPNVTPFWGNERVDPAAYVDMLRVVAPAIRRADGNAVILSAGLAPTTLHEPYNMSDIDYLDAMYRAGAGGLFDIVGVKAYDLAGDDPWNRTYTPETTGIARLVLLREVMLKHGDEHTPMWLVGWGRHATPPGWRGRPSIWGTVSEQEQADYVRQVFKRKRQEWPWLGLLTWDQFYPRVPQDDPLWGFALVRPDWTPRPVYRAFQDLATGPPLAGIGRYGPRAWVWHMPDAQLRHTIRAEGTTIGVIAAQLVALEASLDGEERSVLLDANKEHILGKRLPLKPHTLVLRSDPPGVTTLLVQRDRPLGPYLILGLLALVALGALVRLGMWVVWPPLTDVVLPGLLLVLTGFYMVAPTLSLSLITLGLLALLVLYRVQWGWVAVLASLPFVAVPKRLGAFQFSLVETYVVLSALSWGVWMGRQAVQAVEARATAGGKGWRQALDTVWNLVRPRNSLDGVMWLLLPLGVWAAAGARYQDVAWREVRWVVVEPVLVYVMIRSYWHAHLERAVRHVEQEARSWIQRRARLLVYEEDVAHIAARLINGFLWGSGLAVLAGGILLLRQPEGAYAEGVWRLRGFYGSPNNLALVLGRALAFSLALALFLPMPWREKEPAARNGTSWPRVLPLLGVRQGYALMSGVLLLGLLGTFSRGALLLGLPLMFLFLGWVSGRRGLTYALVALVVLFLLQLPFLATERFRTLLTGAGTPAFRVQLWRASLRMVRDHLWRGVGPDNFLYYFQHQYLPAPDFPEPTLSHPHNILLHFWLSFGLPGLLWILAVLLLLAARGCWLLARLSAPSRSRAVVIAATAAVVYGVAHGLVDESFLLPDLMVLFALSVAILASVEERLRYAGE